MLLKEILMLLQRRFCESPLLIGPFKTASGTDFKTSSINISRSFIILFTSLLLESFTASANPTIPEIFSGNKFIYMKTLRFVLAAISVFFGLGILDGIVHPPLDQTLYIGVAFVVCTLFAGMAYFVHTRIVKKY